jgi:hypothetical protein
LNDLKADISKIKGGKRLKFLVAEKRDGDKDAILVFATTGVPRLPKNSRKIAAGVAVYEDGKLLLITTKPTEAKLAGNEALKSEGLSLKVIARKPVPEEEHEVDEGHGEADEGHGEADDGHGTATAAAADAPLHELIKEIDALKPSVDRANASGKGDADKLNKYYAVARAQAEAGVEGTARKALALVEVLIHNALGTAGDTATAAGEPAPSAADDAATWERRAQKTSPLLQDTLARQLGDTVKMKALWNIAEKNAASGKYELVFASLDRLDKLLSEARAGDDESAFDPAEDPYAGCRTLWDTARQKTLAGIKAIKDKIVKDFGDYDELPQVLAGVARFDSILQTFDDPSLSEALKSASGAEDSLARNAFHLEAMSSIKQYLHYLGSDQLLASLDTNPFLPLPIVKDLSRALQTIERRINR